MEVVSEPAEADVARQQVIDAVQWTIRDLAANLLRIIRGAGKPYEIMQEIVAFVDAIQIYQDTIARMPTAEEFRKMLDASWDWAILQRVSESERYRCYTEDQILDGALQVVASRLVYQPTQESAGSSEMHFGIRELQKLNAARKRAALVESRAAEPKLVAEKTKRKSRKV